MPLHRAAGVRRLTSLDECVPSRESYNDSKVGLIPVLEHPLYRAVLLMPTRYLRHLQQACRSIQKTRLYLLQSSTSSSSIRNGSMMWRLRQARFVSCSECKYNFHTLCISSPDDRDGVDTTRNTTRNYQFYHPPTSLSARTTPVRFCSG